jgi:hypothetical protein
MLFGQEGGNILLPESPVTPRTDTICFYYPLIAPTPYRINMHVKQAGHIARRQHGVNIIIIAVSHSLLPLLNYLNLTTYYCKLSYFS